MMNDMPGKTQREREKQKSTQKEKSEDAAAERLFIQIVLSLPVRFTSKPRSELRGNEEEEEGEKRVGDVSADLTMRSKHHPRNKHS